MAVASGNIKDKLASYDRIKVTQLYLMMRGQLGLGERVPARHQDGAVYRGLGPIVAQQGDVIGVVKYKKPFCQLDVIARFSPLRYGRSSRLTRPVQHQISAYHAIESVDGLHEL